MSQMGIEESSMSTARGAQRKAGNAFDGIGPQASPLSSTVMKKGPWDVFINHRGDDTKRTLASTIYHTLDLIGLHAFLDVQKLALGDPITDEIEEAMRTARLHIAVFSDKYADSPWCLAELAFILKTRTPILPVFYHVDPTDLRGVAQGKGIYAPAFSRYEQKGRYPSTMLEAWKNALDQVSHISGGHIINNENKDEGKLLKNIVNSVLRMIKKEPLEVAKYPVGMDEIVEGFERCREESVQTKEHVEIVGIVGFGGSGKTTLATELYNRKNPLFDRSSFLGGVKDAASRNDLHTKQKKLLEDLRIKTESFDHFREGKRIIADRLKSLRVLIVLDDVGDEDQLDALLPPDHCLGTGSLVIVTTRAEHVLTKCGITSAYKMQPLQHLHAKELFCRHAFSQDSPLIGFDDLVEKCLTVCKGSPLSLKITGGKLHGKTSTADWDSYLDEIWGILPNEILKRLKVIYD